MYSCLTMSYRTYQTYNNRVKSWSISDRGRSAQFFFFLLVKIGYFWSCVRIRKDGTVRQHDLRTHHRCSPTTCPQPLVTLPHDLSALALSPLAPYYFVVGGESECVSLLRIFPFNLFYVGLVLMPYIGLSFRQTADRAYSTIWVGCPRQWCWFHNLR